MSLEQRRDLLELARRGRVAFDEPMSKHSRAGVGGPAEAFAEILDAEELKSIIGWARERAIEYRFWGQGAGTLVRDGGVRGLMIKLGDPFSFVDIERRSGDELFVRVGAATPSQALVEWAAEHSAAGIEWLAGFAGTAGGKIRLNAGAGGHAIGDCIEEITAIDRQCREMTMRKSALGFAGDGLKLPRTTAIIRALLRLTSSEPGAASAKTADLLKGKSEPSTAAARSLCPVFKNPGKADAAVLIEEAGLKGVRVGGARVSMADANCIVNESGATARDMAVLIGLMRERVKEGTGIVIEAQIEIVGQDR